VAKSDDEKKAKSTGVLRIKYMGGADVRIIEKTDTFGGRVPDGIGVHLEWNADRTDPNFNDHLVEVEEGAIDPEVLDLLLNDQYERTGTGDFIPAFKDVTGLKTVPDSEHAKRWRPRGLPDAREAKAVVNESSLGPSGSATAPGGSGADLSGATGVGGSGTGGVGGAG
jgi:hypothetical protein